MSIDQRHTQIKEKAGLEESRLNQDFIEFLKKWGTPALAVVAAISLGYVGLDYLKQRRTAMIDAAFQEYQAATSFGVLNSNPDALVNIATTFTDANAIPYIARLGAADAYLQAVRTGLRPGAAVGMTGEPESEDDLLTDADRTNYLDRAAALYRDVSQLTVSKPGLEIHAISALYGLAAVSEMNGDVAGAKTHLQQVIQLAESVGYSFHAIVARERIVSLDNAEPDVTLYSRSELPGGVPPPSPLGGLDLFPDIDQIIPPPPPASDGTPASTDEEAEADEAASDDAPPAGDGSDQDPG